MATTVRITETYDLKTTKNKLGVIGIHTPSSTLISRLYPGLVKNHKFMRLNRCDVTGVCASVLPADPLQVGVAEGDVSPEDMFNPILYRPVSNDSFETVIAHMYSVVDNNHSLTESSTGLDNPFDIYYGLLSENKRWKKAMPQNGFALRGLYPICYQMINTFGNVQNIGTQSASGKNNAETPIATVTQAQTTSFSDRAITFRGRSVKMPKFPMHMSTEGYASGPSFIIPTTYVAMFIIPPARLHEFYYRMRVTWTITFSGVQSTLAVGDASAFTGTTTYVYAKDFSYESSKAELQNTSDCVDTNDVSLNKIMES